MEIHRPGYWFREPGLDDAATTSMSAILPRVGERAAAGFAPDTMPRAGDIATLLLLPSYSEFNGWVNQPGTLARLFICVSAPYRQFEGALSSHSERELAIDFRIRGDRCHPCGLSRLSLN